MRSRSISTVLVAIAGILFLFAAPAAAGGSCAMGPFEDQRTNEIKVTDMCFTPTVARIDVGDTVTFFNDQTQHMVGGMAGSFGDLHTELGAGEKLSYRFDEEGVYPYACILHPGMGGAIVVGDGEGKLTAAGATQVSRPGRDEDASGDSRSTSRSPAAAEGDSSWLPLAAVIFGVASLMFLVARVFTGARSRRFRTT